MLVGRTGSGKTTLAQYLLSKFEYVVVFDPKGLIRWKDYAVVTKLKKLESEKNPKIIYKPGVWDINPDTFEAFWRWVYERKNTAAYCDEVYSLVEQGATDWFNACLTRGRERGITVLTSTQRPAWVPLTILSESENYYIFRLLLMKDCERVQELTNIPAEDIQSLDKFVFYYWNIFSDDYNKYKLKIN